MNDCVFSCIVDCSRTCAGCSNKISMNSDKGQEIYDQYDKDIKPLIKQAIKPVVVELKKKYNL